MQATLTEDRVLATTNIDSAQKKLEQAIAKHNEKIQLQQTAVLDSEKAFNAATQAADAIRNHKKLENVLMKQRQESRSELLTNATTRQTKSNDAKIDLANARTALRLEETNIYKLKKSSMAGEADKVSAMVVGDETVRKHELECQIQRDIALSTCAVNPKNASFKLETSLSQLNDAVVAEHKRAAKMLPSKSIKSEKTIAASETQEGAMFTRNVGRAETIKVRDCNALEKLEKISVMLNRRIAQARNNMVQLISPLQPSIELSLKKSIGNLERQAQKVMQVEGDMRMKCAEATSFARQAEEEALVAAAMREGKVLNVTGGNALNETNSSVV